MGVGHCCPATYLTKKQAFVLKDHFQVGFCLGVKTSLHAKLKMWSPHMFIFMYIRILSMKKVFARIRFEIGAQGHSKMASYLLFWETDCFAMRTVSNLLLSLSNSNTSCLCLYVKTNLCAIHINMGSTHRLIFMKIKLLPI